MTLQVTDCGNLVFNVTSIFNIPQEDVISLELQHAFNCSATSTLDLTTELTTVYDPTNDVDLGTNFNLTSQLFYEDDSVKFCEGVYYFNWVIVYSTTIDAVSAEVTKSFSLCVFLDCEDKIKCKVKDYYLENDDILPIALYDALLLANDCDTCLCSESCKLYTKLSNLLNLSNVSSSDCGCN